MTRVAMDKRRRKLSRPYELATQLHMRMSGFHEGRGFTDAIGTMRRRVEYNLLSHYFGFPPRWRMRLRGYSGERTLPDFCVIGPIKSGTSDLAVNLMLHPQVMAPFAKEFWIPDPQAWRIYYPTQRQKRRHAQRHGLALSPFFAPFFHRRELAQNLSRVLPDLKIVLVLREPAERIYSHWKWEIFVSGRERAETLPLLATFGAYVDAALAAYPEQTIYTACGFQPIQTSIYWEAVQYWIECFGASNVLSLDAGEYFRHPTGFLRQVEQFVGLSPADRLPPSGRVNENPLSLLPPDPSSMDKLRTFFRPHNQRLWGVIGKQFNW